MSHTRYTIYWTFAGKPGMEQTGDLIQALVRLEELRNTVGHSAITFACEHADQVGSMGVDSVENGMTPDGVEYTWVKRRDGGQ